MKSSIVIPANNEENRLPASLQTLLTYLDAEKLVAEILLLAQKMNFKIGLLPIGRHNSEESKDES